MTDFAIIIWSILAFIVFAGAAYATIRDHIRWKRLMRDSEELQQRLNAYEIDVDTYLAEARKVLDDTDTKGERT